jgi:hypothetical protein
LYYGWLFLNQLPFKFPFIKDYDQPNKIEENNFFADFHYSIKKEKQTSSLKLLKHNKFKIGNGE